MNKLEEIKSRYTQGFINDDQLLRYVSLSIISKEESEDIQKSKFQESLNYVEIVN